MGTDPGGGKEVHPSTSLFQGSLSPRIEANLPQKSGGEGGGVGFKKEEKGKGKEVQRGKKKLPLTRVPTGTCPPGRFQRLGSGFDVPYLAQGSVYTFVVLPGKYLGYTLPDTRLLPVLRPVWQRTPSGFPLSPALPGLCVLCAKAPRTSQPCGTRNVAIGM